MRKVWSLFSLIVLGVGIWLVSRGDQVDRVCKVSSAASGGGEHFNHCVNLVSTYFLGYALTILGVIFVLAAIIVIRRETRHVTLETPPPLPGDPVPNDSNPFRAVIRHEQMTDEAKDDLPRE